MPKTKLQIHLADMAPTLVFETIWQHDEEIHPDMASQAWQAEVRVSAIHEGNFVTGSAYLGGVWEKRGDNPAESNPDISGYEADMTLEALSKLYKQLPTQRILKFQVETAVAEFINPAAP